MFTWPQPVSFEEREKIVNKAVKEFDALGEFSHLVAGSNVEFAANVREAIPLAPIGPIPETPPLTELEKMAHEGDLLYHQIFGQRADNPIEDLPECFRVIAQDREAEAFAKMVGPGVVARKKSQDLIDQIVEQVLAKSQSNQREFPSQHDREHLLVPNGNFATRVAARAKQEADETRDPADILMAKALADFASGDKAAARKSVRAMLAA